MTPEKIDLARRKWLELLARVEADEAGYGEYSLTAVVRNGEIAYFRIQTNVTESTES